MKHILQKENKVLRQTAKEVSLAEIKTPRIKKILKEMGEALRSQHDGVAIAAPQIGYSLRIFIVSGKVLSKDFFERSSEADGPREPALSVGRDGASDEKKPLLRDLIFINPKITRLSKDKEWLPEGCLSVRWLYGKTFRSKKAFAVAYDENGKKFTRGASGLLAQIFQHETDHLNGILFIDHAKDVKEEKPNEHK